MLFACARSQDETPLQIEGHLVAADLGTATHDGMRSIVDERKVDAHILALRHGVSIDELAPLIWFGRKAWEELRASFPRPETEVDVEFESVFFRLDGHIDLLSVVDNHARFVDWKAGRKEEADYYAQLAGYATCLILGHGCKSATASVVWLRSQTIETYQFEREDVLGFEAKVLAHLAPDARYRHGLHCAYCVRSHDCEALIAISRRDVAIFGQAALDLNVMQEAPEILVSIRRRAKTLEVFAASLDDSIRRRVMASGPLASGDGYALSLVEENGKREVETLKAWPVLQKHLSDDEIASCVTVSAKSVDDLVAKKAGRGRGAEAKRQLAAELEAEDAVTQPKIVKLKEVRLPRAQTNKGGEAL
jgi:hypothetical protein